MKRLIVGCLSISMLMGAVFAQTVNIESDPDEAKLLQEKAMILELIQQRNESISSADIELEPTSEAVSDVNEEGEETVNEDDLSNQMLSLSEAADHSAYFQLFLPEQNQLTVKSTIKIKGINRALTPVFVQDQLIPVREDGRFMTDYELSQTGKQVIRVTVANPELELTFEDRRVLYLNKPQDLDDFPINKQLYVYGYNTSYLYNPSQNRLLADAYTRADLAYFVAMLKGMSPQHSMQESGAAVTGNTHWGTPYLKAAVAQNLMSEFPDGSLKADEVVTLGEYIMTMIKVMELEVDFSNSPLPYSDVNPYHWTAKFIRTARNHQLIPLTGVLGFDKHMTLAMFMDMAVRVPAVSKTIDDLLDFESGFDPLANYDSEILPSISAIVQQYKQDRDTVKQLSIAYPQAGDIFLTQNMTLEGRVYPSQLFTLDGQPVTPDVDGSFLLPLVLKPGKNTFVFEHAQQVTTFSVFYIEPYQDLSRHWVNDTAAKLRFAGRLPVTENYQPKQRLTRGDLATLMVMAFDLPSTASIVEQGILKGDAQGGLNPNRTLKKVEALVALMRAGDVALLSDAELERVSYQFKDIPSTHWAVPVIKTALQAGIISDSPYFFPNKPLTKAEYAAMLYRIPRINELIKVLFNDQAISTD